MIVGFTNFDTPHKSIFEYEDIKGEVHEIKATNINPYLVDAKDLIIKGRSAPLTSMNKLDDGSIQADGGSLILSSEEKKLIESNLPDSKDWIRRYLGGNGFLNGEMRYCLWLKDCSPEKLNTMPEIMRRIKLVREMRLKSAKEAKRKKAETPTLFTEDRQPSKRKLYYNSKNFFRKQEIHTNWIVGIINSCW